MDRSSVSGRAPTSKGLPVTPKGAGLAESLKAELLTSLDFAGRQAEGGLEVPCPIAPPLISPPATPNHDLPHANGATAVPEHGVHGAAWWETPVPPTKTWCGPPDCLDLLSRPSHNCVELLQRPAQDCVGLLQRPPKDCVEVFKAHHQAQAGVDHQHHHHQAQSGAEHQHHHHQAQAAQQVPQHIPRQIPPRHVQSLSANAPEFVPEGSSVIVPAVMSSSVALESQRMRLEDSIRGILKADGAAVMPEVAYMPPLLPPATQNASNPDSMCCPPIISYQEPEEDYESSEDVKVQKPTITLDELPASIPSLGSVNHGSGDCRRCNFFHKGRCQNGRSCVFCHMPHEKRKTGRVEPPQPSVQPAGIQIARGAPGLEPPAPQMTTPGPVASRAEKVSMGTQTEDDLPPCLLCRAPPSVKEPTPEKVVKKGVKELESGMKELQSFQQTVHVARLGG